VQSEEIVASITSEFDGVIPKSSWGETSLFYNPGKVLPSGVYFCTIKEKNGDNDKASKLDREGVYRLSIGISKTKYKALFGKQPKRPNKGGIIDSGHDFTALDELMPHPIYGWMSWVQILNPEESTYANIILLITEAYSIAVAKFNKRIANNRFNRTGFFADAQKSAG
jgi:hypothetical protein